MGNSPNTNPKYTRVGPETITQDDKILTPEIDPLVEEGIKVVIEEIITGQIMEID